MGACSRYFVVSFAALFLTVSSLRAQDTGPLAQAPGQPPCESLPVAEPCVTCCCGPSFWFEADWLWTSRATMSSSSPNFIDGPDAASFSNLPGFSGDNGYRFRGGAHLGNWVFEGIYSHFGAWESSLNQSVDGVAFNPAGVAGDWAGKNSINRSTYFTPIVNAASLTTPASMATANDQSGLGPSATFSTDPRPVLMAHSHSDFYMTEANVKGANYLLPLFGRGLRLGVGYVNANFNNDSWVALSGTFRAVNAGGTVSLPDPALTSFPGGNLTLYSGTATGFTDGVSNGGGGIPSQVLFTHSANTRNQLNGAQLVLDGDLLEIDRVDFGMTIKGGLFDNFAEGTITETYRETNLTQSAYARQFSDSRHQLAFLGGLGVSAKYHLTDEIAIGIGYEMLYLSNLALGPEQINGISNSWYHVQTGGTAFIQSVQSGVEIAF